MDKKSYEEISELAKKQEELLRFPHFNNKDAWDLGCFLVQRIYEKQIELAVAIRKLNGSVIFQYGTEQTNQNNINWMKRKFNTVALMERSSYGAWAASLASGETVLTHGLNENEYVFCGGGFPIRLTTGEIVAVLTVSNLPHEEDHRFMIDALKDWLNVEDVPFI